ncbi:MAG: Gfo/Idh/MocA family oxidoreductase [Pirellulales bacterium]
MKQSSSRRTFVKTTAVVGAGYWAAGGVAPRESRSAIERIQFGCIGIGGKGRSDSEDASKAGDVVAVTDIDDETIEKEITRFPNAAKFNDFREMLGKMGDKIDAVTVSVPDHSHAVATAMALKLGKACFTQKPLTRTIWEARRLADLAKEKNVATQMGNQGSDRAGLREAAARIKSGAIGTVKEVHVWTNRPVWPQGIEKPKGEAAPKHSLGAVHRSGSNERLQPGLPSVQVARILGLRHRSSRRYGLPYHEHAVRRLRTGEPDRCQGSHLGSQWRDLSGLVGD